MRLFEKSLAWLLGPTPHAVNPSPPSPAPSSCPPRAHRSGGQRAAPWFCCAPSAGARPEAPRRTAALGAP